MRVTIISTTSPAASISRVTSCPWPSLSACGPSRSCSTWDRSRPRQTSSATPNRPSHSSSRRSRRRSGQLVDRSRRPSPPTGRRAAATSRGPRSLGARRGGRRGRGPARRHAARAARGVPERAVLVRARRRPRPAPGELRARGAGARAGDEQAVERLRSGDADLAVVHQMPGRRCLTRQVSSSGACSWTISTSCSRKGTVSCAARPRASPTWKRSRSSFRGATHRPAASARSSSSSAPRPASRPGRVRSGRPAGGAEIRGRRDRRRTHARADAGHGPARRHGPAADRASGRQPHCGGARSGNGTRCGCGRVAPAALRFSPRLVRASHTASNLHRRPRPATLNPGPYGH